MGLTIGVRFIEGGKSKRAVIISEIRRRNAYLSRVMKVRTNRRLRRRWCHRIQDRQVPGTKLEMSTGDESSEEMSSEEIADIEESFTSSG